MTSEYYGQSYYDANVRLVKLAVEYHKQTETYDHTVCRFQRNGIAVPTTNQRNAT